MNLRRAAALGGVLSLLMVSLAACSGGGDGANAAGRRPATTVGFVVVKPTAVPLSVTLSGLAHVAGVPSVV